VLKIKLKKLAKSSVIGVVIKERLGQEVFFVIK